MWLEIDALKEAAAWPDADQRTTVVLASQLMAAERYQEGFDYFTARSDSTPADALSLALAGAFQARLDGETEEAIAKLDAATGLGLGLPHYFRGTSLARLPRCAGRAETVVADLEFVLAVRDQFPPGLMRAVHEGLSHAYELLGRTAEAEAARSRSGRLITDYSVDADDGFRFVPQQLVELAPDVHVAQGYDFSDLAFVVTAEGVVAIDSASTPEHAAAALRDLRRLTGSPITHVILTHAHWDHVGGLEALTADGATVIAQANFPDELRLQNSGPEPFRYFLPGGRSHRVQAVPDQLVSEPEKLTVGGVEFVLIPIAGGETHDGLIVHVPDREVVFTGDMSMPYLGAPFFAEGSAEGLFEAMETVMELRPRLLIHGHSGLTATYTIEAFPGLLAAFRDLDAAVRAGIADGLTLAEILRLNHLPQVLKDHPSAVIPYLVSRDHFIQRVHRQRTGYWHPRGEGVEHFTPAEMAGAVDLLGGGTAAAFHTAGAELTRRGEYALALRILDLGLLSHPGTPELLDLRHDVLQRLIEGNQLLNPFKFVYYAGLADLELAPPA
ncbi:MBL fold metallo-hydrolase [Nonomuraea sediminis]|uniref:MBL fold metallo-hydrolase n=1 Tax=Nonomuraea sediminis TaxID=2835864 RepID=UPI001BDD6AB1|nr:MBL fold metallo-hydrolase [Nonomuraea sediminis]